MSSSILLLHSAATPEYYNLLQGDIVIISTANEVLCLQNNLWLSASTMECCTSSYGMRIVQSGTHELSTAAEH